MIEQTKLRKEIITVLQHRDQVRKLLPEAKLQRGRDLPGITKQKKKKMKEKKRDIYLPRPTTTLYAPRRLQSSYQHEKEKKYNG